jgi:hypothetical protein
LAADSWPVVTYRFGFEPSPAGCAIASWLAMLGNVGDMSKTTLAHALVYLLITVLRIERLLFGKHARSGLRRTLSQMVSLCFRAVDNAFLSYVPTYWK